MPAINAGESEADPLLKPPGGEDGRAEAGDGLPAEKEAPAPDLSWAALLMFTAPYVALNLNFSMIGTWLTFFYLPDDQPHRVSTLGYGGAAFFGRLIDGLWGVQVGYLSDQSRLAMGRRRPFILMGTPLFAIAFGLLFFPPTATASTANVVFLMSIYVLYSVGIATVTTPFNATVPEITTTPAQRMRLTSYGGIFSIVGHIFAAGIGPVMYYFDKTYPEGLRIGSLVISSGLQLWAIAVAAGLLAFVLPVFVIRERPPRQTETPPSASRVWSETWHVTRNPAFVTYALATSVLTPCGNLLFTGNLPYLFSAVFETESGIIPEGQGDLWLGLCVLISVVGSLAGVPIMLALAHRYGKRRMLIVANLFVAFAGLLTYLAEFLPDPAVLGFVGIVFISIPSAAFFTLPQLVYADVVDAEYAATGVRREGIYAGAARLWNKIGMAVAQLVFTAMLDLGSSPGNNTGVVYIMLLASAVFASSAAVMWFHPIHK